MRHLALEDYSASRIFLRRCSLMNSLLVGCGMILANQKLLFVCLFVCCIGGKGNFKLSVIYFIYDVSEQRIADEEN